MLQEFDYITCTRDLELFLILRVRGLYLRSSSALLYLSLTRKWRNDLFEIETKTELVPTLSRIETSTYTLS
jgi:hypothetical protein